MGAGEHGGDAAHAERRDIVQTLIRRFAAFLKEEDGPTATEYAVLLAVISITVMVAMAAFGQRMTGIYVAVDAGAGAAAAAAAAAAS